MGKILGCGVIARLAGASTDEFTQQSMTIIILRKSDSCERGLPLYSSTSVVGLQILFITPTNKYRQYVLKKRYWLGHVTFVGILSRLSENDSLSVFEYIFHDLF